MIEDLLTDYMGPGLILIVLTTFTLLLSRDWRWIISAFFIQYLGVFLLVIGLWPLPMAVTKLIAGLITVGVLWTAWISSRALTRGDETKDNPYIPFLGSSVISTQSGNIFRLFAAGIVLLAAISSVPTVVGALTGIGSEQALGALLLIGLGLLHLGFTAHPFRVVVGLLTVLSGFEVIYAAIESSVLIAGLLTGVTMGLALVGAYLLMIPTQEGNQ
jgi:hypothetical protein